MCVPSSLLYDISDRFYADGPPAIRNQLGKRQS